MNKYDSLSIGKTGSGKTVLRAMFFSTAATSSLEDVKAKNGTALAETILQNCTTKIMLKPSDTHDLPTTKKGM